MKKIVFLLGVFALLLCGCSAKKSAKSYPEYFKPIVQEIESAWTEKNSSDVYMILHKLTDYDEGLKSGGHEKDGTFICYIYMDDEYYNFDMKEQLAESEEWDWSSAGVFRKEGENRTYVCYTDFNRWGEEVRNPQLMLIEFDADNPEDYQGTPYMVEPADIFCEPGMCYRIGDNIYITGMEHATAIDKLGVINLETKELSYCNAEYDVMKIYAQKIIDGTEWKTPRSMSNFKAMLEKDDVMVYGAQISDGFDAPADILIFVAFRDGEPIAYMSVDLSVDELSDGLEIEVTG